MATNRKLYVRKFRARPGINLSGICQEYEIGYRNLTKALKEPKVKISDDNWEKIQRAVNDYGGLESKSKMK